MEALTRQLRELGQLGPNWDSYDGLAIDAAAVKAATGLVERVLNAYAHNHDDAVPWAVLPVPDGGIELIWKAHGTELQLDISPDGSPSYLLIENVGHGFTPEWEHFTEGKLDSDEALWELLARVLGPIPAGEAR